MYQVFIKGSESRTVEATLMNSESSRSHSIFILSVTQTNSITQETKTGKLYFVDLAGSEKQKLTGATGSLLDEAKNINQSLMCLGMVINALTEGKGGFIPYRNSKLTRILQESLGGNSLTTLIIACTISSCCDKESLGTLKFGLRAKSIKNKPKVNQGKSNKDLLKKLSDAEEKIKSLELEIKNLGIEYMKKQIDTQQQLVITQTNLTNKGVGN